MAATSGGVSNRLRVKKNERFPGFLTPAVPLARGGGGDRRAQVGQPGFRELGPFSACLMPHEFLEQRQPSKNRHRLRVKILHLNQVLDATEFRVVRSVRPSRTSKHSPRRLPFRDAKKCDFITA